MGLLSIASHALSSLHEAISISYLSLRLNKASGESTDIRAELKKYKPDIVGVSAITCDFPDAIDVLKPAKEAGCKTIIGGIFPTLNSNWILDHYKEVDVVVRGEGERAFTNILKAELEGKSLSGISGIAHRASDGTTLVSEYKFLEEVGKTPLPEYDLIPMEKCKKLGLAASTFFSLGCSGRCTFCSVRDMWRGTYRTRHVSDILRELELLSGKYKFDRIKIVDEIATSNSENLKQLLRMAKDRGLHSKFRINSRLDALNERLLVDLYDLGVDQILFGIESASKSLLCAMDKSVDSSERWSDKALNIAEKASAIGYTLFPTFLIGWPGETTRTLNKTAQLAVKIGKKENVIPYLSFVTPHPGSQLYKIAGYLGLQILTANLRRYTHLFPVAVPSSLGKNGLDIMVKFYDLIASETNTREWNPKIDRAYIDELRKPLQLQI